MYKYKEFCLVLEGKFGDDVDYKSVDKSTDIFKQISNYNDSVFVNDVPLIDKIVIADIDKIVNITWYDPVKHDLIKRINDRTNFKSISEFNQFFEYIMNQILILPSEINDIITKNNNKYNIYMNNRKFSILLNINYRNLFETDTIIEVTTIYNSTNNKYPTIYIDDI
jgi:hypothetical protein